MTMKIVNPSKRPRLEGFWVLVFGIGLLTAKLNYLLISSADFNSLKVILPSSSESEFTSNSWGLLVFVSDEMIALKPGLKKSSLMDTLPSRSGSNFSRSKTFVI